MLKRVTLLERRPDISPATFSSHWRTDHAVIATDLPGLLCYRQNHVAETVTVPADGSPYRVDGIVELWFTGADDARAGLHSDVADRLVADEPRFLAGLTGGTMTAPPPEPLSPYAVWVLAGSDGRADLTQVREWADPAGTGEGASVHLLDDSEPLLVRTALRQEPQMPQVLVRLPAAGAVAALTVARDLGRRLPELDQHLRRVQVLTAAVVPIVEAVSRPSAHAFEGDARERPDR